MGPFRTFLFAPGNHPRRVEKVFTIGADAVILDLEDAVAISEKAATRAPIVEAMKQPRSCLGYVRVNAYDTPFCYGDLMETVGPWLDGIVLPKVESAAQLLTIDWLLVQLEREHGIAPGTIDLIPIIETGPGAAALAGICTAGSRVKRLSFGAADYTLDMGMVWSADETELASVRAAMVLQSRVAGLEPPIDTVFIRLGAEYAEALERSARSVRAMGFQGKMCIHPEQVGPINGVFTPSADEVARAKAIVAAFEDAEASGSASIQLDGQFIDYPVVIQARRVIGIAENIGRSA
jgi:citrate lyase subunit beta/citryl-CoA lyase